MRRCRINNIFTLFLLLLILSTIEVVAFGRPRKQHHNNNNRNNAAVQSKNDCSNLRGSIKNSSSTNNKAEESDFNTDIDPYYNCGLVEFGFIQKIPYQNTPDSGHNPLDVNFSSACIRCGICIAIVERINQSLIVAHDVMRADEWFDDTEADLFLRAICDHEFRHYSLREFDGKRYIGDSNDVPGATPVASSADGQWETTLKKKCHEILDDVDTRNLYKKWRDWCNSETAKPLVEILCRSADSGRMRDCINLDDDPNKDTLADDATHQLLCSQSFDWQARVKVTAQIGSRR